MTDLRVGEVFTPQRWAKWLLDRWGIFDRWVAGESICDPTAGRGVFALALLEEAKRQEVAVTGEMLNRLHLNELRSEHLEKFSAEVATRYGISFPASSLHAQDVICHPLERTFDILVGNPPWCNFCDLPSEYKEQLKPYFVDYGLVPSTRAALLGSSRVDLAALVLKAVIEKLLVDGGDGYFFAPLSLFCGDGAHIGFRDYKAKSTYFAAREVVEFTSAKVFEGVGTSYAAVYFRRGERQSFPVLYFRAGQIGFRRLKAIPLRDSCDPWRIMEDESRDAHADIASIKISSRQKPRQGVNTCGANSVFIFDSHPDFIDPKYVFPLATKELWRPDSRARAKNNPKKWIFLPYDSKAGKPLASSELKQILGYEYLSQFQSQLGQRKGTLLNSAIGRGYWWALLGVGRYSFAPFKVIWEAYGNKTFEPIVVGSCSGMPWQANQAMQAFIPCWTQADATRIREELRNPAISLLLEQLNGQGKSNFAQPGKIKKILSIGESVGMSGSSSEQTRLKV